MIGTACPSLSTSRSLFGFQGSFGSHRIWWYSRTVTRWASDSAVDGCPLPADVVISTDSFPRSTAFRLAACSKLMTTPWDEANVRQRRGGRVRHEYAQVGAGGL